MPPPKDSRGRRASAGLGEMRYDASLYAQGRMPHQVIDQEAIQAHAAHASRSQAQAQVLALSDMMTLAHVDGGRLSGMGDPSASAPASMIAPPGSTFLLLSPPPAMPMTQSQYTASVYQQMLSNQQKDELHDIPPVSPQHAWRPKPSPTKSQGKKSTAGRGHHRERSGCSVCEPTDKSRSTTAAGSRKTSSRSRSHSHTRSQARSHGRTHSHCRTCSQHHSHSHSRSRSRSRSVDRTVYRPRRSNTYAEEHAECVSCCSSCSCTSGCESEDERMHSPKRRKDVGTEPASSRRGPAVRDAQVSARSPTTVKAAAATQTDTWLSAGSESDAEESSGESEEEEDGIHLTFSSPSKSRQLGENLLREEKELLYANAQSSVLRSQQGYRAYVLTSGDAVDAIGINAVADPVRAEEVLAKILERKLVRYEPRIPKRRGSLSVSTKRKAWASPVRPASTATKPSVESAAAMSGVLAGSGNLSYYDTTTAAGAASSPSRFRMSAAERSMSQQTSMEEQKEGQEDKENDMASASFLNDRSASMLASRHGLHLRMSSRAGLVPIRRIRELRLGVVAAAHPLVARVNEHVDTLSLAEEEKVIPQYCVSIMVDTGGHKHHGSDIDASPSASPTRSYASKHAECIDSLDPVRAPRVRSSFEHANVTSSQKVAREIRRNQRKLGVAETSMTHKTEGYQPPLTLMDAGEGHPPDPLLSDSMSASVHSALPSPNVTRWVVIATSSLDEAHTLLNSLAFLQLAAGKRIARRERRRRAALAAERKQESVVVPVSTDQQPVTVASSPSPASSPIKPPSKKARLSDEHQASDHQRQAQQRAKRLQPTQLTEVLLTAAQHAAQAELDAAARKPAGVRSERATLKRKSTRTPAVSAVYPMPASSSTSSVAASAPPTADRSTRASTSRKQTRSASRTRASAPASSSTRGVEENEVDQAPSSRHSTRSVQRSRREGEEERRTGAGLSETEGRAARRPSPSPSVRRTRASSTSAASSPPPPTVQEWLASKRAEQERAARRAARRAEREEKEKEAKKKESQEAYEKWMQKQEEDKLKRSTAAAEKKAEEQRKKAEEEATKQARREQALKAYRQFIERTTKARAAEAAASRQSESERRKKEEERREIARQKFDEWVKKKGDWLVERVRKMKKKRKEQNRLADGAMNDDDPEEEAALDWHWLEREVAAEMAAAARQAEARKAEARRRGLELGADGMMHGGMGMESSEPSTDSLLYEVLDEVDVEVWAEMARGIEDARAERERLQRDTSAANLHMHLSARSSPLARSTRQENAESSEADDALMASSTPFLASTSSGRHPSASASFASIDTSTAHRSSPFAADVSPVPPREEGMVRPLGSSSGSASTGPTSRYEQALEEARSLDAATSNAMRTQAAERGVTASP